MQRATIAPATAPGSSPREVVSAGASSAVVVSEAASAQVAEGSRAVAARPGAEARRGAGEGSRMIDRIDVDRIAAAITEVEKKTSGEIMVVAGRSASGYHLVPIVWAALITLAAPMLLLLVFSLTARRLYEIELIVFGVCAFV